MADTQPEGIDAVKALIANLDTMAAQTLLVEADCSGPNAKPYPPALMVEFTAGMRRLLQDTATVLRFIVNGIEAQG